MLVRVVTLQFQAAAGGFDDAELRDFIKDKEVVSINDHLFIRNEIPYLALVVKYFLLRPGDTTPKVKGATAPKPEHENWKGLLTDADMGMFSMLREWRTKRCQKEGVPPYVLFTNRQLAEIIKARPLSLIDLGKIEGIGKAKIDKYGLDLLAFFQDGTVLVTPEQVGPAT